MKKRKILVLFPLLGLFLSGCTFQEAMGNVKSWTAGHVLDPIKNLFNGGKKEEQSTGGDQKEDEGEKPAGEVTVSSITIDSYTKQVAVNYEYKTSDVSITVHYSDGTSEVKEPESVTCNTSQPGAVTLTVTYKGVSQTALVTVLSEADVVHVDSIRWEVSTRDLHKGESVQITVTFAPENVTNKNLAFVSSDESVLTVSATGLVEAIAVGSATVKITPEDNPEKFKEVTFTVSEAAVGLPEATKAGYTKLAATETLKNGEKVNFAGAIGDKFYAMPNYTSGNNIKAKEVSTEDGKLVIEDIAEEDTTFTHEFTAIDNGDGTYSFMQANGKYLSAAGGSSSNYLKVADSINDTTKFKVAVDANGNTTLVAEKVQRGSLCLNPNNGTVIFACYAELKYEAYALYHDGKGSTEHVAVEGIAFEKSEYSIEEGNTLELSVNVLPALATDKQYSLAIQSAEPEGCITLSGNIVTAVSQGSAVILAKSHENEQITATATITVTEHIERNYGSLENPLSVAQAKEVIDLDGGQAKETVYVSGVVSRNEAYSTKYNNTNIWITDGVNEFEFELYAAVLPSEFEPAQPIANDPALVGKTVVAHGTGKIYNEKYELDKGCQVDSVGSVAVTGITLDKNELEMEVGMPDETLVATIAPASATNKAVEWESANPEVATVNNGVVHAVAAGETTITVSSVADPTKSATCNVTVSQQTKELVSVQIKTMPKVVYTEGEKLDLSDLVLTLYYDDASTIDVTTGYTTNIALDHELTTQDTELIITYGEFALQPIALTINEAQGIVQPGSYWIKQGDYYLSSELGSKGQPLATTDSSKAVIFDFVLEDASSNEYKIKEHDGDNYLDVINDNNGVRIGSTEAVWTIEEGLADKTGSYLFSTKDAGDNTRYLTVYNNTDFRCYKDSATNRDANTDVETPVISTLESISVTANPTKTSYLVGETFVPAGLEVTAHYELSDNTSKDVVLTSDQYELSFSGAFAAGDVGEKEITVSFGGKQTSFVVEVSQPSATLTSISIEGNAKAEYTVGESYSYEGLTATAHYSDETTMDVTASAEWAVSKATAEANDESVTITASFGGETGELVVNVTVSQAAAYQDATMTKGTSAYDDGTVNGKACIKIGTSKLGGDMTITLPAGAKELVVYAVAWKGVSGLSLNITADKAGVTTDPTSIALTADDGATSNSPFTLVGDESNYKFVIALSGVTEETVLTFATSAAKRCIVWGAQYR